MVMRAHCDRCDETITNGVQLWLEERGENSTAESQKIWHIRIGDSETSLCPSCRVFIINAYLNVIKEQKELRDLDIRISAT